MCITYNMAGLCFYDDEKQNSNYQTMEDLFQKDNIDSDLIIFSS